MSLRERKKPSDEADRRPGLDAIVTGVVGLMTCSVCIMNTYHSPVTFRGDRAGCHELSLPINRVCTGPSSDSERARDQWQCAAVTPQVNLSFSVVSCVSKHVIEFIAIES